MNFRNRQNLSTGEKNQTKHFVFLPLEAGDWLGKVTRELSEWWKFHFEVIYYHSIEVKKFFCILILYSVTLINSSISSRFFCIVFCRYLRIFSVSNHVVYKEGQFSFSFLILMAFISFLFFYCAWRPPGQISWSHNQSWEEGI